MNMKIIYILLIVAGIVVLFQGCASFWEHYNATHQNGTNKFYELMTDLSPREAEYIKMGAYEPKSTQVAAPGSLGKFIVWYPAEMESSAKQYPVIISNNHKSMFKMKTKSK